MQRLTVKEVREQYGGMIPPDAVLRPDDDERERAPMPSRITPSPATTGKPKGQRRSRSERFAVLNAFVDAGMVELTGAETKVWLVLFRDTKASGTARTGQTDIARRAGLSVPGVKLALHKLREKGMVRVVRRGQLNGGPSVYRLHPTSCMG